MAGSPGPMSGQARRFTAAALIVVVVVLSVWLFGRPEPETTVQVVVAAEDWPAGRLPGEFVTMAMPQASAALFVTADQLADRVPAVAVPAGTVVSGPMLTDSVVPAASDLSAALLAVAVDPSLWPDPGPRAGDARRAGRASRAVAPLRCCPWWSRARARWWSRPDRSWPPSWARRCGGYGNRLRRLARLPGTGAATGRREVRRC